MANKRYWMACLDCGRRFYFNETERVKMVLCKSCRENYDYEKFIDGEGLTAEARNDFNRCPMVRLKYTKKKYKTLDGYRRFALRKMDDRRGKK